MSRVSKADVIGMLQEHGAIANGHFELLSGLHSPTFITTAVVLQYPHMAQKFAAGICGKFPEEVDVVLAASAGAVIIGQEVARCKKCRAISVERLPSGMILKRDFRLSRDEKILVVQDVLTTGRSTSEAVSLALAYGAKVVGVLVRQEFTHGQSSNAGAAPPPAKRRSSGMSATAPLRAQRGGGLMAIRRRSGHKHRAAVDLAIVQVVQGVVRGGELVLLCREFDQPAVGERHQLHEFGPGAYEIADDVALRDDHVHSRNADVLAVADHVIAAHRSGHFQALCRRAFFADEIDDGLGALAVGQFKDRFDFVAIRLHEFPLRSPFR